MTRTAGSTVQTRESWIPRKRGKDRIVQKRTDMARLPHKPERSEAGKRQNRSNNETGSLEKSKRTEIISGLDPTLMQTSKQPVQENRQEAEIFEDSKWEWTT